MSTNKIELSFGIPAYNATNTIEKLLNSFNQDIPFRYEVIVVDDGSNDDTAAKCKKISSKNTNIKIFSQKNTGVSGARNKIIKEASGKWLTFVDADDEIIIRGYEELLNFVKTQPDSDFCIATRTPKQLHKLRKMNNKLPFLIESELINTPCTKLYKLATIKQEQLQFDTHYDLGEDLLFNIQYYTHAKHISYFYCNLYKINQTANSLSNKNRQKQFDSLQIIRENCIITLQKHQKISKQVLKAFEFIKIKNAISSIRKGENQKTDLAKIKKLTPRKYIILNTVYTTLIYNIWFIGKFIFWDFYAYIERKK